MVSDEQISGVSYLAAAHDGQRRLKWRHLARQRPQQQQAQVPPRRQRRVSAGVWRLQWRHSEGHQMQGPAWRHYVLRHGKGELRLKARSSRQIQGFQVILTATFIKPVAALQCSESIPKQATERGRFQQHGASSMLRTRTWMVSATHQLTKLIRCSYNGAMMQLHGGAACGKQAGRAVY